MKTTTWKNDTDCCSWHGVKCDAISGYVIGLNLGCEGLQGIQELDMSSNDDLEGQLPELSCGASLSILDLSH
ncbi:receptor-like protein, partial [Trifolium medium]|nr:receptor-like protein [Trifolium medium]